MRGRIRTGIAIAVSALVLSGCAGSMGPAGSSSDPSSSTSSAVDLSEQLAALPGVEGLSGGDSELVVTMTLEATDEEVLAVGAAANTIATEQGRSGPVTVQRVSDGYDVEADMPTLEPWRLTVYPADPAVVERSLTGALEIEDVSGVMAVYPEAWPLVVIDPVSDVESVFAEIAQTAFFADGGTYTVGSGEHLTIVHVPERTTVEAVQTIVRIAADYPEAEFLLQATEEGPQWPHLLVAHLDAEQGAALDARLREPDLADADPEGFAQQFQLTVIGPDGATYIEGTLGDVPR